MFKRILSTVLLMTSLLSISACSESGGSPADTTTELPSESTVTAEIQEFDKMKTYNILFIGNSYTYYNGMPEEIFPAIAEAAGCSFNVKQLTKGGWDLVRSGSADDELGALVDAELKETKYDYVVIQEQSTNPADNPGKFYDGVRSVYAKIKENGATPILYGTWGRKEGHEYLDESGLTNETMTWKIAASYEAISKELSIPVAQVGLAFYDIYTNNGDKIDVYADDLTHPSYSGSYLAAMTIFAKITGIDPTTIDYKGERAEAIADIMKEAARKAVFETPEIPEEYKTSSEGVVFTKE